MKYTIYLILFMFSSLSAAVESCQQDACGVAPGQRACVLRSCKATKTVTKTVEKVVEKSVPVVVTKEVVKEARVVKKNRISLMAGAGPNGHIRTNDLSDGHTYSIRTEPLAGVQYQRMLNSDWSLGAQVLTNQSAAAILGYDF